MTETKPHIEAKTQRFCVDILDVSRRILIEAAARHENAHCVYSNVWGVRFDCDEETAIRILALAGEMATSYEALRLKALVDVLRTNGVSVPSLLEYEADAIWETEEDGYAEEFRVRKSSGGSKGD